MAGQDSGGATGRAWWQVYSERRYGLLLVLLLALLAGPPVLFGLGLPAAWFDAAAALGVLAAVQSLCFERRRRVLALALGVPTIAICFGGLAFSGPTRASVLFVGHLCGALFLLGSAGLIVSSLFHSRSPTFDSIHGAVCGYLFLGLAWAMSYAMIESVRPGSFQLSQALRTAGDQSPHQVLTYYSFVTLTTVGYGDVTPVSPLTRTFAWMEAIAGQFYLAIVVAGLVSTLAAKHGQPRPPGATL
jgi:hypothetical protein